MERLRLTILLGLSLVAVLQGQIGQTQDFDLTDIPYYQLPEADCCQPSEEDVQTIGGATGADACTVMNRGCKFGCSRCSNHTGSVTLGNTVSGVKPVCPAETSVEEEVCCTPAQTQRRWTYCNERWYSYEYPITCDCGPCEYLPSANDRKCGLYENTARLVFYIFKTYRCYTKDAITRRTCRGQCSSSEHSYIVIRDDYWTPVYRKNCQCCEGETYEVLSEDVICPITTSAGNVIYWAFTTDIQVIKTCGCNSCRSKPFWIQALEDEQEQSEEPILRSRGMGGAGIMLG